MSLKYSASIVENEEKVEVMRFKVQDDDEKKTKNWDAVFDIVSGNEDGIFSIKTDPKTNEGVLMLEKVRLSILLDCVYRMGKMNPFRTLEHHLLFKTKVTINRIIMHQSTKCFGELCHVREFLHLSCQIYI